MRLVTYVGADTKSANQHEVVLPALPTGRAEVELSILRRGPDLVVWFDGRQVLEARFSNPAQIPGPYLALRAYRQGTNLTQVRLRRERAPVYDSPLSSGDILLRLGLRTSALERYVEVVKDQADRENGALAFERAWLVASELGRADLPDLQSYRERVARVDPVAVASADIHRAWQKWQQGDRDGGLALVEQAQVRAPHLGLAGFLRRIDRWQADAVQAGRVLALDLTQAGVRDSCHISDLALGTLTGLQGWPLRDIQAARCDLADLSPLVGADLRRLDLTGNRITDLRPLARVICKELILDQNPVEDLSPLTGRSFSLLSLRNTPCIRLADGMAVERLFVEGGRLTSLEGLRVEPLTHLTIRGCPVASIGQLVNAGNLSEVDIRNCPVASLAPLAAAPLTMLACDADRAPDFFLRPRPATLARLILEGGRAPAIPRDWVAGGLVNIWAACDRPATGDGEVPSWMEEGSGRLFQLGWIGQGLARWPSIRSAVLKRLDLRNNRIEEIGDLSGIPQVESIEAEGNPIRRLGGMIDHPPPYIALDVQGVPAEDWIMAAGVWARMGRTALARNALACAWYQKGWLDSLSLLAETVDGYRYLHLPVKMTREEAAALALRCGAHLVTMVDPAVERVVCRQMVINRGAWIGLDVAADGGLRWDDGRTVVMRRLQTVPPMLRGRRAPWMVTYNGAWQSPHDAAELKQSAVLQWAADR